MVFENDLAVLAGLIFRGDKASVTVFVFRIASTDMQGQLLCTFRLLVRIMIKATFWISYKWKKKITLLSMKYLSYDSMIPMIFFHISSDLRCML